MGDTINLSEIEDRLDRIEDELDIEDENEDTTWLVAIDEDRPNDSAALFDIEYAEVHLDTSVLWPLSVYGDHYYEGARDPWTPSDPDAPDREYGLHCHRIEVTEDPERWLDEHQ